MNENELRNEIVTLGASLFERGLTAGSSGNISVRTADGGWLMTPTNSSLGSLDPLTISRLSSDGKLLEGDPPTKESFLHTAIYEARPQAQAVVHLHSTYAVAISCLDIGENEELIPPLTPYFVMRIGDLARIPYFPPGDPSLGDAVRLAARNHSAFLLANHGPVVSDSSLRAAVYASEELEETAKLFFLVQGMKTRHLTNDQVAELHRRFPKK